MANILLLEDSSLVGFGGGQKMSLLVASILSKKHNLFFIDFTKDSTYLQKLKSDFPNAKVCYLKRYSRDKPKNWHDRSLEMFFQLLV